MLTGLPDETRVVESILTSCSLVPATIEFLAQGSTSRVWRADTSCGAVVIRLGDPAPGKAPRFNAEAEVQRRLFLADGRTAEPLAISEDGATVPWCVDRFIGGESPPRGAIPEQVCHDLGQVLSSLHALPVSRYGLLEDRRGALSGQASDPTTGILTRLQDPWPFTPYSLEHHPLIQEAPDLYEHLAPLAGRLRAAVVGQPCCLNHTDLHERQMRIEGSRLAGLLDFGDATIGPPAWDIASFAYFHGWRLARLLLAGYTRDLAQCDKILADAHLFSILIALHHASRSVTLQRPRRMQDAIRFLRSLQDAWPP
jgi:aminoglycoside phosphotransferase (APT) family kinase protein